MIEWLNENVKPNSFFEILQDKIIIIDDDIQILLNNSFYDMINELFSRTIFNTNTNDSENSYPICAFSEKLHTIYIYDKQVQNDKQIIEWQECTREKLIRFLNIIHIKISKYFYNWKKNKENPDDKFDILCDKTLIKLMNVDLKQESIFNKLKNLIYNKMKTDLKMIIELELEF